MSTGVHVIATCEVCTDRFMADTTWLNGVRVPVSRLCRGCDVPGGGS